MTTNTISHHSALHTKQSTMQSLSIAIFCSAAQNLPTSHYEQTKLLGRWIGEQRWRLVYGGASLGLMEYVARAAKEAGGIVAGVIPDKLVERGIVSNLLDENIPVHSLGERKEMMLRESDLFIALPGGLGTLDEIFHVLGESSIGYHSKPVVLYNINGFWDSMLAVIGTDIFKGFISKTVADGFVLCETPESVMRVLRG